MEPVLSYIPQRVSQSSLLHLLSTTLVLYQTIPYIPVSSLLALGATSKGFRDLIYTTPNLFKRLDLSEVKSAQSTIGSIDQGGEVWRSVQLDEHITEDDFYGGPLRGIFHDLGRRNILQDVRTLVLDGLAVPADLVTEIITSDSFNVRILSIRDVKYLNERKLQQALLYAIRPSRAANTPRVQGIYLFGPKDIIVSSRIHRQMRNGHSGSTSDRVHSYEGVMSTHDAQIGAEWNAKSEDALAEDIARNSDKWFGRNGKLFSRMISDEWAEVIQACQGVISFDAVVCAGPRHSYSVPETVEGLKPAWYNSPDVHISPKIATYALDGCSGCGKAPEGLSKLGCSTMDRLPLLAPPTLHASTTKAAKTPLQGGVEKSFLVRCVDCLRTRYCEGCHKWWCEDCYHITSGYNPDLPPWDPGYESTGSMKLVKPGVIRSCFECGLNCANCVEQTQMMCKFCGGGYCLIHNEGSSLTTGAQEVVVELESCTERRRVRMQRLPLDEKLHNSSFRPHDPQSGSDFGRRIEVDD